MKTLRNIWAFWTAICEETDEAYWTAYYAAKAEAEGAK